MDIVKHYDMLIEEGNDPVRDPPALREYMDRWDGQVFLDALHLDKTCSVLEIGIGTGRLAVKTAPFCKQFTGIDLSSETVERAKQHLADYKNVILICVDYLSFDFGTKYDVIYSSLTWLHFPDKQKVMDKTAALLTDGGRFVLSVGKEQSDTLDYGTRKIKVFPDDPDAIIAQIKKSGLLLTKMTETENAFIFVSEKR